MLFEHRSKHAVQALHARIWFARGLPIVMVWVTDRGMKVTIKAIESAFGIRLPKWAREWVKRKNKRMARNR